MSSEELVLKKKEKKITKYAAAMKKRVKLFDKSDYRCGNGSEMVQDLLLLDVTPLTLSIEDNKGFCIPVIRRNSTIPCKKSMVCTLEDDYQASARVRVYQGERKKAVDNKLLTEVVLKNLTPIHHGFIYFFFDIFF